MASSFLLVFLWHMLGLSARARFGRGGGGGGGEGSQFSVLSCLDAMNSLFPLCLFIHLKMISGKFLLCFKWVEFWKLCF